MLVGNDAYEKFIYYIENIINFSFLSHIPGSDDTVEMQRESIINIIKRANTNEAFLDYISYTYTIFENDIIKQILSISWTKGNGEEDRIINDDKFDLRFLNPYL